ncbi:MAG TPA: 2-C-methyl-D-erythritol 4-phosphate cytidylyltransferase, partial [Chloroflexota bacterium]|nr:2-C-methyl-D-erythritol 4-phosphate cytidylyltransferase [Chloroflexota bacterium]
MREATPGKVAAIVVGAGSGQRLGGIEKAFMPLAGHPLIAHSVVLLERMPEIDEICLVVANSSLSKARLLVDQYAWRKVTAIVPGGTTRQDSVLAGLHACSTSEWVMIHDAARPLLTRDVVRRGLQTVTLSGAALAAIPVRDTIKQALSAREASSAPLVMETVDRSTLWHAQTPQVFRTTLLRAAFAHLGDEAGKMTDDAAVAQAAGHQVHIFNGDARNLKITLPEDVAIADALLAHSSPLREGDGT